MAEGGGEAVVVGVRVRPFNSREIALEATCCVSMTEKSTTIIDEFERPQTFTFDESFWSHDGFENDEDGYSRAIQGQKYHDQRYVYDVFGQRVLDNAWGGYHCCLFAYGQTGAGKSYSMVGYGANKGIVPISCDEIFKRIAEGTSATLEFEVCCSMVEIYNETVQDLLVEPESRPKKGLEIRESKLLGIYIDGVAKRYVDSYEAIETVIDEGTSNRTVGSTLMNATSSRAHTVITIELKQSRKIPNKPENVKLSTINLVDLAGSEKAGQTGATGDRLKEGSAINKSLSALGNVIERLAQKSQGKKGVIIPYRESKLTRILQNALGGSAKTIMICALSPASSNCEETMSTLRYADRAKKIKNTAQVNANPQDKLIAELAEENERLKGELEKAGQGPGRKSLNPEMALELQRRVEELEKAKQALAEMQKTHEEHMKDTKNHERMQRQASRSLRRSQQSVSVVVPTSPAKKSRAKTETNPYLVNINDDEMLSGKIKYSLNPDVVTSITNPNGLHAITLTLRGDDVSSADGESDGEQSDITLGSKYVFKEHARIHVKGDQIIMVCNGEAGNWTWLNGKDYKSTRKKQETESLDETAALESGLLPFPEEGVVVRHRDRIIFGKNIFVAVKPQKGMIENFLLTEETLSYESAKNEVGNATFWKDRKYKIQALYEKNKMKVGRRETKKPRRQDPSDGNWYTFEELQKAFGSMLSPEDIQAYWEGTMLNPEKEVKKELEASGVAKDTFQKVLSLPSKDMTPEELEQELKVLERELKDAGVENVDAILGFTRELAVSEVEKKNSVDLEETAAVVWTDEDEDDFVDDEDRPVAGAKYKKVLQENGSLRAELMDKDRELDQLREKLAATEEMLNGRSQAFWRLQKEVKMHKEAEEAATSNLDKLIKEKHKGTKLSKTIRKQREMEVSEKRAKEPKGPQSLQNCLSSSFEDTFRRLQSLDKQILDFGERQKEKRIRNRQRGAAAAATHGSFVEVPMSGDESSEEGSEDVWSGSEDSGDL